VIGRLRLMHDVWKRFLVFDLSVVAAARARIFLA
jgi:hypothetical protein